MIVLCPVDSGSGNVSMEELRSFFKGSPLDDDKQIKLFATLDRDGSGEVSREEWRLGFHAAGFDGSNGILGQSTQGLGVLLSLVAAPRLMKDNSGAVIKTFAGTSIMRYTTPGYLGTHAP